MDSTLIRILNILLGLWALYASWVAAHSIQELNLQTVLILLFVFTEAIQGVLLVLAPKPQQELQHPTNIIPTFGVIFLTIFAGVNVVHSPLPSLTGVTILLAGQLLSLWAVLSLGRLFGVFAEVRGICTKGPYRYLSHPMYVGYGLQYIGLAMQTDNHISWTCLALAGLMQVWRAIHETQSLRRWQERS